MASNQYYGNQQPQYPPQSYGQGGGYPPQQYGNGGYPPQQMQYQQGPHFQISKANP